MKQAIIDYLKQIFAEPNPPVIHELGRVDERTILTPDQRRAWQDKIKAENFYSLLDALTRVVTSISPGWGRGNWNVPDDVIRESSVRINQIHAYGYQPALDWAHMGRIIDLLRSVEGDCVTIVSDNPEFDGPARMIVCQGGWTNWEEVQFTGDTLVDCFDAAERAYWEKAHHGG